MMKKAFYNNAGFTTAELLIVMVLSSLFAAIIFLNYLFINKSMADWRKGSEIEQQIALYGGKIDYAIRHLSRIDSIAGNRLIYQSQFNRREVIDFSDKPDSLKVVVDSVSVNYFSTDIAKDRNLDGIVDVTDLDENIDKHLDSVELRSINLVDYQMRFSWGNKKSFWLKSYNRLLNRKPIL